MKGLLLKDIYVLTKQMKLFVLMAVVFAVLPGQSMNSFAVIYAAMLPYTSIAYDERSKWDQMAAMLPYSPKQIVIAKYMLGYLCVLGISALSLLVKLLLPFFGQLFSDHPNSPATLLPTTCLGLLMLAVTLPFMLRFGVEKGRMIFIFVMVGIAVWAASMVEVIAGFQAVPSGLLYAAMAAATVAVNAVSICVSIRLYPHRNV